MTILDAPHFPQQAEGYCLPACAQMVLAYLGIPADQDDLARQLGARLHIGAPYSSVTRLESFGLNVIYSRRGDWETLQHALERNLPVIVFVQAGELPQWRGRLSQHTVVVIGIGPREADDPSQAVVWVLDPAMPSGPLTVPLDDFMLAWDEMDNAYAVFSLRPS